MSPADATSEQSKEQVNGPVPESAAVLQYEWDGAWMIVAHGHYDMQNIAPLAEALEDASEKYSKVVVDASRVTFADSTFLNLLLRVRPMTALRVAEPAPQLLRVLELTGAGSVLDVRDSVEEATAS
ncbi:STAS domain-containing protein [Streptomyces sp. NPDC001852]|uniref:STAS domain-containing protein n=1 Tax=Streptomyces sp. NPDC001852 TaxID=3364619 RepID=UPI003673AD42